MTNAFYEERASKAYDALRSRGLSPGFISAQGIDSMGSALGDTEFGSWFLSTESAHELSIRVWALAWRDMNKKEEQKAYKYQADQSDSLRFRAVLFSFFAFYGLGLSVVSSPGHAVGAVLSVFFSAISAGLAVACILTVIKYGR